MILGVLIQVQLVEKKLEMTLVLISFIFAVGTEKKAQGCSLTYTQNAFFPPNKDMT
jgi:hypothetical protein